MVETDRGTWCGNLAERTLAEMRRLGVSPSPENYAVWYSYCAKDDPELVRAVERIVGQGRPFTQEIGEELFNSFFGPEQRSRSLREASRRLQETMAEVLAVLEGAKGDTARYGERLASFTGEMQRGPSGSRLSDLIHEILSETQLVLARTRSMESEITRSAQEVNALRRDLATLRREASTDALTGLTNRKHFEASLKLAATEVKETNGPLSLVMLDVDHFKRFNDTYGHRVGDEALRLVARLIQSSIRVQDLPARYGGEEFAIILPATPLAEAREVAERIRSQLAQRKFTHRSTGAELGTVTISAGVATLRPGEPLEALIERADAALYRAKGLGRNRVAAETAAPLANLPEAAR